MCFRRLFPSTSPDPYRLPWCEARATGCARQSHLDAWLQSLKGPEVPPLDKEISHIVQTTQNLHVPKTAVTKAVTCWNHSGTLSKAEMILGPGWNLQHQGRYQRLRIFCKCTKNLSGVRSATHHYQHTSPWVTAQLITWSQMQTARPRPPLTVHAEASLTPWVTPTPAQVNHPLKMHLL